MSYLLWQRDRSIGLGSARVVLRAANVPVFADAHRLRDKLEQLNEDAAQRIAAAAEDARVQGYVTGREQALREARDEMAQQLAGIVKQAAAEREQTRGEIAALALQVVRKLLGQFPADGVLAALAQNAAREQLGAPSMTLFVHPDRVDSVRTQLAAIASTDPAEPRLDVKPDPECKPDVCRIETEFGTIDASLEAQLNRIADAWGVKA